LIVQRPVVLEKENTIMSNSTLWARGRLCELDPDECRELLASKTVGRIAFGTSEGPVVLPVNYVVAGDQVLFRTAPHNVIAKNIDGRLAAFEVDEVDDYTQSGWSVLVRGTARFVESVDDLPTDLRPDTWPEGIRRLFVSVDQTLVTGRRLLSS
jgi:hypothetical protein